MEEKELTHQLIKEVELNERSKGPNLYRLVYERTTRRIDREWNMEDIAEDDYARYWNGEPSTL